MVIPLDTVVRGDPGSVHEVAEMAVPVDRVGLRCSVQSTNNRSVHPDTDLLVSSGTSMVTLFDVERERRGTTDGDAPLTLGETATVEVTFVDKEESQGYRTKFGLHLKNGEWRIYSFKTFTE